MATIEVLDDGGDIITTFEHNGFRFPNMKNARKILDNFHAIEIRSDDVFICTFPKSGTNWMFDILRFMMAGKVDTEDVIKRQGMLEVVEEETYRDIPSPRILNTHVLYNQLPEQVEIKKPKIIYVDRNPKDVAVSFYSFLKKMPVNAYKGEWKNYLRPLMEGKFYYGSWFDYVKNWEEAKRTSDLPILFLNYEDMKEDLYKSVEKIRDFLKLERSEEFLKEVCKNCDFSTMKKTKVQTSDLIFRKGQVGDWKNWFTVAQNEWFDQLYQEKMKDCQRTFRFTL